MRLKFLLCLLVFGLVISLTSASFNLGNPGYEIQKEYPKDSYLISKLNISFTNHPLDSNFTDSLYNKVPLIEILDMYQNSGYNFSCNTPNCQPGYALSGESAYKTINLNSGQSKVFALKITGPDISSIDSLTFTVESNAKASCTSTPFRIDVGNDGTYDVFNDQESSNSCSGIYRGCWYSISNNTSTSNESGEAQEVLQVH